MNPCPPCSSATGLLWYYWVLIAIGIIIFLAVIVAIVRIRLKRRNR
jgi:4-amino-4-deoxy-L-arabinose transferase-like glycosyltransferase